MKLSKIFFQISFISFFLIFCFLGIKTAGAQSSTDFMFSWSASSYAPSWYQGKFFPIFGSRIDARFELLEGGKIADLSKTKVRWYINDDLVANELSGLGLKRYSFFNKKSYGGNDLNIRVNLPDYKGQNLEKIFIIPVNYPEVAIEVRHPNGQLDKGQFRFTAWPFFFNVLDLGNLKLNWALNGKGITAGGNIFNLNIGADNQSGQKIEVGVNAYNPSNQLEAGKGKTTVTIK